MNSLSSGPVLVIAAHADDEVLGCGGTMARLAGAGCEVHSVFMTDGVSAREGADDGEARRQAACLAASKMGSQQPVFNDFPDNSMDMIPLIDIARVVESAVARIAPVTILTHHHGDLNIDHEIVHRAVMTACRPQPGSTVRTIMTFSVRSSTEWAIAKVGNAFVPNFFVDVTETLETKLEALRAYEMEMRAFPHSRSIEAVEHEARLLGASCGVPAAEAFVIVRSIMA